ncbi:MAG: rhombosortase [Gammaproteobacteria bacterium]|nr:rhombosortase [Beggiatoa alba]PCH59272.1 MAG: rhombosortase [Gammaproteobacteria bacterium]
MKHFQGKNLYWLALISATIMLLPDSIRSLLYLNFERVLNGEIWRVISGHVTHLSWTHWLLNMAGIILLQQLYGKYFSNWHWLAPMIFIMFTVSISLLIFSEALKWYGGFSGVLIGFFYFAASKDYRYSKLFNTLVLISISLYILIQQLSGERIVGLTDDLTVAARAHLFGALAGLLWLFITKLTNKFTEKNKN